MNTLRRWLPALLATLVALTPAVAQTPPAVTATVEANVFEVVVRRPLTDPMTYAEPLPWDKLSFQERAQREYLSVGTAFAIPGGQFVTAAHVLSLERPTLQGEVGLRTADGQVYPLGPLVSVSTWRDFAVFLVPGLKAPGLIAADSAAVNTRVYTAGNALGSGLVVREGLLTSRTPEEWKGSWQNLRFSAPASPGNSGGPLLNDQGQLLGVVTRKSEAENLNYALPWSEVDRKPVARLDELFRYGLPLANDWIFVENHKEWPLPLTAAELRDRLSQVARESQTAASVQLRQKLIPGAGVVGMSRYVSIPGFLEKKENGLWEFGVPNDAKSVRVGTDGSLNLASRYDNTLFALTAPSAVRPGDLTQNPKLAMDLFLQGNALSRTVAGKPTRILSFGDPAVTKTWEDGQGRVWFLWRFDVPELEFSEEMLWLPTPTGGLGLVRGVEHASTVGLEVDLVAMTDYVVSTYTGTLEQWTAFLSHPERLPRTLRAWSLYWKPGQVFVLDTGTVRWKVPATSATVQARSVLAFIPGYYRTPTGVTWLEGTVAFAPNGDYRDYLALNRNARPLADDGAEALNDWALLTGSDAGFDGIPYNTKDRSMARARLKAYPISGEFPDTVYWMALYTDGFKDHAAIRSRFAAVWDATELHVLPADALPHRSGTTLYDAVRENDTALVDRFLDDPRALSLPGPDGLTPLQVAVRAQRWPLVEKMLNAGASTASLPGTDPAALGVVKAGNRSLAEVLLKKTTPTVALLDAALDQGWTDLVLKGADTPALRDAVDDAGRTLLLLATSRGNESLAMALLDRGAATAPTDKAGWNALDYAIRHNLETVAFRLWTRHPEELASTTKDGWTGLHLAAAWRPDWLSRFLQGNGKALVNKAALDGTTPLHLALQRGDGWKTLLDAGADPRAAQKDGWTPAALALRYQVFGARETLPAEAWAPTKAEGWNLVQLAARYQPVALRDLTSTWSGDERRRAVQEKGPGGRTALHWAVLARSVVAIRWLLDQGASLDARDDRGRTPADQARAQGDEAWFAAVLSR